MTTFRLIIEREFVSNVLTSRFMIGFTVCLMSTAAAVFVQIADYEKRLAAYHVALQEHQEETRTWDLYSQINPKAHRKPNSLSIFNVGTEKSGADMVSIELATPIWGKGGAEARIRQPIPLYLPSRRCHFRFQNRAECGGDPVRLQYDFRGTGRTAR